MKPAAFVSDGLSMKGLLAEIKAFDGKVFATPKAAPILEEAGIRAVPLGDPLGITRIFSFGHKEIHLYGFDLSNAEGEGTRIAYDNRVFWTTPDLAQHAQMMMRACMELGEKGATIGIHGDGMFPHMARSVMRDLQETVLTAVYDLTVCPPTYEVFSFLSEAERYRVAKGMTKIDVMFMPGPIYGFRDDGLPPSVPERESMLHRICVSGARLLPSVRNIHVMKRRGHLEGEMFPPDWTNDRPRFRYGPRYQKNPHYCLEATRAARAEVASRFENYVTITMREAEYWPKRNSDLRAWSQAARYLQDSAGYKVVMVPDTHGRERIHGFEHYTQASWDIDLRLALYEGAALNLAVMNGPMVLCQFAKQKPPYLIFQKPDEDSPGNKAEFMEAQGYKGGDQYGGNGVTLWENDSPENVMRAVKAWSEEKTRKEAA